MQFLHYRCQAGQNDQIIVTLSSQARVLLLDNYNFAAYKAGNNYRYSGGWATRSPVHLGVPHAGNWHVAVDLEGRAGAVQAGVRVARAA